MNNYCYLAGPISGLTFGTATDWRKSVTGKLPSWLQTLSPLRCKDYLAGEPTLKDSYAQFPMSTSKAINTRDHNDVKRSAAILVNLLDTQKASIGTVMEIAWAYAYGVPVILVMKPGNVHDHAMINECAGFVVDSLDKAIDTIVSVVGNDKQVKEYFQRKKDMKTVETPFDISAEAKKYLSEMHRRAETAKEPDYKKILDDYQRGYKLPVIAKLGTPGFTPLKYGWDNGTGHFVPSFFNTTCDAKVDTNPGAFKGCVASVNSLSESTHTKCDNSCSSSVKCTSTPEQKIVTDLLKDIAGAKSASVTATPEKKLKEDHVLSYDELLDMLMHDMGIGVTIIDLNDLKDSPDGK